MEPMVLFGIQFTLSLVAYTLIAFWYVHRYRLPVFSYCDAFAPAVSLAHAIGRLGCFMAGCCFGRPVGHDAWYALVFPADVLMVPIDGAYTMGMPLMVDVIKQIQPKIVLPMHYWGRAQVDRFQGSPAIPGDLHQSLIILQDVDGLHFPAGGSLAGEGRFDLAKGPAVNDHIRQQALGQLAGSGSIGTAQDISQTARSSLDGPDLQLTRCPDDLIRHRVGHARS